MGGGAGGGMDLKNALLCGSWWRMQPDFTSLARLGDVGVFHVNAVIGKVLCIRT